MKRNKKRLSLSKGGEDHYTLIKNTSEKNTQEEDKFLTCFILINLTEKWVHLCKENSKVSLSNFIDLDIK